MRCGRLFLCPFFLLSFFAPRPAEAAAPPAVPPSADWVEVQRYNGPSHGPGPYHVVYLIPGGTAVYLVRISNFAKYASSPGVVWQTLELGEKVPGGRSWQTVQRWEKNPSTGEGDVEFDSTFAIPIGSSIHLVHVSNLDGLTLERLPASPIALR